VESPGAAFYSVSDSRYFLGAVGMVNSLRLLGHREPVYVLDCGLTDAQRALLAPQANLVPAPSEAPPWLLKTVAPLRHPAEVMVLMDADIVATRPLTELIEIASHSRVVAFQNDIDRFVPEWGELLDLGPVRRQPYLSSGFVALSASLGKLVLGLMEDRQDRVDFELTYWRRNVPEYPFLYGDQCVFNAILASRVEPERIAALDNRLASNPPFRGLRVVDESTLRCAYGDGTEPYLIHHFTAKPWLESTFDGVYSRLLRRLLTGADLPVRVPKSWIPLRMRTGPFAYANRKLVNVREQLRWRVLKPLAARTGAIDGSDSRGPSG
jgi:hypothetical protein